MTSCVFPLALWTTSHSPPLSRTTLCVATEDSSAIVTAMEDGNAIVWRVEAEADAQHAVLRPSVFLVGKGRRITAMTLCKIDIDGAATTENIVLIGTEDGDIVMWDLKDGRALQAFVGAFPGPITQLLISSSGRFIICAGLAACLVILDAASLDCLKVVRNLNGWTSSMGIFLTGPQTPDQLFRGTTNGTIDAFLLDEVNLELVHTGSLVLDPAGTPSLGAVGGGDFGSVLAVRVCRFSPNWIMAVKRKTCHILERVQSQIRIVCSIYCNMDAGVSTGWTNGQFLNSRTVMLFTEHGTAHTYFIGHPSQLACGTLDSLGASVAVLVSDGVSACGRGNEERLSASTGPSTFSAIASFAPRPATRRRPRTGCVMILLNAIAPTTTAATGADTASPKWLICFETAKKAVCWPVWANMSAQQIIASCSNGGAWERVAGRGKAGEGESGVVGSEGMIKPVNSFEMDLGLHWTMSAAKSDPAFKITAACLVSDKLIAIGC
ncbi:WD repeat-containing protein 7, partial [Podochytrium sp. JEL0797]